MKIFMVYLYILLTSASGLAAKRSTYGTVRLTPQTTPLVGVSREGDIVYDSATKVLQVFNGTSFDSVSISAGGASPNGLINLGSQVAISTNDLVVDLTQADGSTDPSTGDAAVIVSFRNSTITNGGFDEVSFIAATSITLEAQDSIGSTASVPQSINMYVLSDTTDEICLSLKLFPDDELASATALTAGAETDATTLYCTGAHTSKPIRWIGSTTATWSNPNWGTIAKVDNFRNPAYTLIGTQIFTSSGTWTPTAGTRAVMVEVYGGGGGGGGADGAAGTFSSAGGGGGGGGYSLKFITVGLGSTETVTVGAAGGGGAASGGGNGGAGGTSSFGGHAQATGGLAGIGDPTQSSVAVISAPFVIGGVGSLGDVNVQGEAGSSGLALAAAPNSQGGIGGKAAGPSGGAGGVGVVPNNDAGGVGFVPGGGGGGGYTAGSVVDKAGGAGAAGIIIVWEYR